MASAAVLVAACGAAVVGLIVFGSRLLTLVGS
jgi:diacylglycerol kinase